MKVTISTDILQRSLAFVNHAISTRSQLAILTNILLDAREGKIRCSATDLEIGIEAQLPATVHEEGTTTVPAKTFLELINSLPLEQVTIETIDGSLIVTSKKTKSSFQTTPASEFPKLYEERGDLMITMDTAVMRRDFGSVVFSASQDTTRPALSGVLVQKEENGLLLVATDGYRLSLKHHQYTDKETVIGASEERMIVPARVFREVLSSREQGETVAVYASREKNQILFQLHDALLIGRLIEAEFPPYGKIIPSDFSARTFFDREELQKAVKICSIFARDAANIIKLSLKKDKIIVSSHTQSVGENTVEVDAALHGEENEIAFNARYLSDLLSNIGAEDMSFEMTGPLNPGVFKLKDDESYLHLIMPIRVQP